VYNDKIKLKGEHKVMGRENQGKEQGREDHQSQTEPKTLLQLIQPPIQT
jgi:hypothetical protein